MSKREHIKYRRSKVEECVLLAEGFAARREYEEAGRWYRSAAFHEAILQALLAK